MSDPTPPPGWGQPPQTPPSPPAWQQPQAPSGPPQSGPPQSGPPQYAQGWQQPPAYPAQGYGPPGPAPQPPKKSRAGLIILAVFLVVGGIIAAAVALVLAGGDPVVVDDTATTQPADTADGSTEASSDNAGQPDTTGAATPDTLPDAAIDLQVGDCFNGAATSDEVANVQIVPCNAQHEAEVFLVTQFPDDGPFPGAGALDEFAADVCKGQAFEDYVGQAWADSRYFTSQFLPTEAAWDRGFRDITCSLYDPQSPQSSSARGSGQ